MGCLDCKLPILQERKAKLLTNISFDAPAALGLPNVCRSAAQFTHVTKLSVSDKPCGIFILSMKCCRGVVLVVYQAEATKTRGWH